MPPSRKKSNGKKKNDMLEGQKKMARSKKKINTSMSGTIYLNKRAKKKK